MIKETIGKLERKRENGGMEEDERKWEKVKRNLQAGGEGAALSEVKKRGKRGGRKKKRDVGQKREL